MTNEQEAELLRRGLAFPGARQFADRLADQIGWPCGRRPFDGFSRADLLDGMTVAHAEGQRAERARLDKLLAVVDFHLKQGDLRVTAASPAALVAWDMLTAAIHGAPL